MQSTILIFIDGVGIGEKNPESNPFFKYDFKFFTEVFKDTPHLDSQVIQADGKYIFPTDASMGIPEIPLSGTGQTSIFCGVNAQKFLGHHFGPFPHSLLIPVIKEKNIFKSFLSSGKKAVFANAYPKMFFDYIKSGKKRLSVTSLSCMLSDMRLNTVTDLRKGDALSAEIDNSRWVKKLNYNIPIIKPETAAKRLLKIGKKNHFTLFEYFLTDHLGHGRISDEFDYLTEMLDRFLYYMLTNLDNNTTLLICSDHGNFENISQKAHTLNPALTISAGKYAKHLFENIKDLSDIKGAILETYE